MPTDSPAVCPLCKGSGRANSTSYEEPPTDCPSCGGTGDAGPLVAPVDPFLEAYNRGYRDALTHAGISTAPRRSPAQIALRDRILAAVERRDAAPTTNMREAIHANVVELRAQLAALEAEEAAKPAGDLPELFKLEWVEPYDGKLVGPRAAPWFRVSVEDCAADLRDLQMTNLDRIVDALNAAIASRSLVMVDHEGRGA